MSKLAELFWIFIKMGTIGFGGGNAIIPLIQAEIVDNRGWLSEQQFIDYLAMGYTLPGPIAPKMGLIIGYDQAGYLGAALAFIGILLPSTIAILVLFNFFLQYRNTAFVKGMQAAAKPVVTVLIGGVVLSMARGSVFSNLSMSLNTWIVLGLFVVSLVLILLNEFNPNFYFHPAFIIIGALLIGGFFIK